MWFADNFISGKKKSVKVSLLFKQNWSADFEKKKSTRFRVFKEEVKREVGRFYLFPRFICFHSIP